MANLVEELRQAIRGSGLSLNEMERQVGVSHAVLSRFMRGERTLTLPLASAICDALGLHLCRVEGREPPAIEPRKPGRPPKTEQTPKRTRGRPRKEK